MILLKLDPKMETLLRRCNTELTGVNLYTSNLQSNLYRVSWVLVGAEFSLVTIRFTSLIGYSRRYRHFLKWPQTFLLVLQF